ncbi:MAG: alpha/beta fold hydrolase [Leptospirales bacterium]|jgi:pimeloyl-ACP methyl ester carboxylesterase
MAARSGGPGREFRVLLLPALATDRGLYASLLAAMPDSTAATTAIQYGPSRPGETLRDYARRQFTEQFLKDDQAFADFDLVIGTSFGGMAAQELIAGGLLQTRRLVLISTCFSGRDLTWFVRLAAPLFPLLPCIPPALRRLALLFVAWIFPVLRRGIPDPAAFTTMIARADVDFLFSAGTMISRWRTEEPPVSIESGVVGRTLQIHGTRDPVLSYRKVSRQRPPEVTVAEGDHIMILRRAPEIAGYIVDFGFWN